MEDFIKYLADILEFLVGGVLVAAAIVVSCALFFPESFAAASDVLFTVPDSFSLIVSLGGLGLIYGIGVIAEGISRALMEWRLSNVTHACFVAAGAVPDRLAEADAKQWTVKTREDWRAVVEADESGYRAVTTQLSRLRIERIFLLASYIMLISLTLKAVLVSPVLLNGYGIAALLMAAFSIVLFNLVNTRFARFVNGIVREYARLSAVESPPPSES